jgi:CheY-like chemotaxis protein
MRSRSFTLDLQPWAFAGRPRVLVEHPDPDSCMDLVAELRRRGCTVAICKGPDSDARCPVHSLEPCCAVEGADVVLTALGFEREDARSVLRGLRTRYPSTPLIVEAAVADALELEDDLRGCTVIPENAEPGRVAEIVAAITR